MDGWTEDKPKADLNLTAREVLISLRENMIVGIKIVYICLIQRLIGHAPWVNRKVYTVYQKWVHIKLIQDRRTPDVSPCGT